MENKHFVELHRVHWFLTSIFGIRADSMPEVLHSWSSTSALRLAYSVSFEIQALKRQRRPLINDQLHGCVADVGSESDLVNWYEIYIVKRGGRPCLGALNDSMVVWDSRASRESVIVWGKWAEPRKGTMVYWCAAMSISGMRFASRFPTICTEVEFINTSPVLINYCRIACNHLIENMCHRNDN